MVFLTYYNKYNVLKIQGRKIRNLHIFSRYQIRCLFATGNDVNVVEKTIDKLHFRCYSHG